MKKRVLSFLLAMGIAVGNCASGMAVIAEEDMPVDEQETVVSENGEDDTQQSENQGDSPDNSDSNDNTDPSHDQDNRESDQKSNVLTVSFSDSFPSSHIYYGQESLYWHEEVLDLDTVDETDDEQTADTKTTINYVIHDYMHVSYDQIDIDDDALLSQINVEAYSEDAGQNYLFRGITETVEYQDITYTLEYALDNRHIAVNTYTVQDPQNLVKRTVEADRVVLKVTDNRFLVSDSNDPTSFSESTEYQSASGIQYYLRNVDTSEDNDYYLAIAGPYLYDEESNAQLEWYAVIDYADSTTERDFLNLSEKTATKRPVKLTLTAYANATQSDIKLALYNEYSGSSDTPIGMLDAIPRGQESDGNHRNKYEFTCTYNIEDNTTETLQNMYAELVVSGKVACQNPIQLTDSRKTGKTWEKFILDKIPPVISMISQEGSKVTIDADDAESGIESYYHYVQNQYWKNDWNPWGQSKTKPYTIDFSSISDIETGDYDIFVKFIDKAGNETIASKKDISIDKDHPEIDISTVRLFTGMEDEDGVMTWTQITNDSSVYASKFGVFTDQPLRIDIEATDNQQLKEVLLEYTDEQGVPRDISAAKTKKEVTETVDEQEVTTLVDDGDYYTFEIYAGVYRDAYIIARDTGNNSSDQTTDSDGNLLHDGAVSKILNSYFSTTTYESDNLFVDTVAPVIGQARLDTPDQTKENGTEKWFGDQAIKDTKKIAWSVSDNYGIKKIVIKENTSTLKTVDYSGDDYQTLQTNANIEVLISELHSHGKCELSIVLYDYAGHSVSLEDPIVIYLDSSAPVLDSEGIQNITSEQWNVRESENWAHAEKPLLVQLEFTEDNPDSVMFTVNGNQKTVSVGNAGWTDNEDGTHSVQLTIDGSSDIVWNEQHEYEIAAVVMDKSGNQTSAEPIVIHVDTDEPAIQSVSVKKQEGAVDQILRILTFGLFSNQRYEYVVKVSDTDHDSGIAEVTMQFEPDGAPYLMTYSSELSEDFDAYTMLVPQDDNLYAIIDSQAYDGYIVITASDFTERTVSIFSADDNKMPIHGWSDSYHDSTEEADTSSNYFMVESHEPTISIQLPDSDSGNRTTDYWYKYEAGFADNPELDKLFTVETVDAESGLFEIYMDVTVLTQQGRGIPEEYTRTYTILDEHAAEKLTDENYFANRNLPISKAFSVNEIFNQVRADVDGCYTITVTAIDNAGNSSSETQKYYVDSQAPQVDSIDLTPVSADNYGSTGDYPDAQQFVDVLEYGFYFHEAFTATVNITDPNPSSGLYRISYRLQEYSNGALVNNGVLQYAEIADGKASFVIPADFKGQIYVNAVDNVGNTPETEVTPHSFVVDTPERHDSETHIDITGYGDTGYRDGEGNPLYDSNVTLTVKIIDTMSGIRQITYDLTSEKNESAKKEVNIANTGNSIGQDLGDGWSVTAMDENLVTEVTKVYTFSADDNNIQLLFEMTDRSNNTSTKQSDVFSIDQTAPVINVVFANAAGNGEFYRESRTATVTVTERNFDPGRISASIQNSIGGIPALSFTDNSNTEHVATLTFGEGDYSFSIEGTDLCGHTAAVNYSGGNEQSFHIDLRDPIIVDNFNDFINNLENSFNSDKEMTFTITEHNFTAAGVNIRVYRAPAGQELTDGNREDCTSEYVTDDMWSSNGDTHSTSFTFSTDYVYQVSITVTDKSGRTPATATSPVFEIDKTKPVLKTPVNLDKLVYTKKSTQTEADSIIFEDSNIDKIAYSVVAYQMKLNDDNVGYDMKVSDPREFEVKTDSVIISDDYFKSDGIYEVKSIAYDVAGNASDESTHTFVIQRDTDFLVYIPNSNKENQTGLYKFNEKGIRSADFDDIEIISYITEDKTLGVRVGDDDVTGDDITVKEIKGSDLGGNKKNDETINQVTAYDLTLKNSFIAQNYDADTVDTDLVLNAVASSDDVQQVITLGHIYIDNVKPVGEYEDAIQNLGFFDGFYGMESRDVTIEGVSPDIDLDRCEIQVNDQTLKAEDGGFIYNASANTISFTINKGYTDIRPTLVDNAGNINNLPLVKKVYVGGVFARFWYLFIFGGLVILAIPTLIIMALLKKKKSRPFFK